MNFHNRWIVLVLTKTYWPSLESGVELQVSCGWPSVTEGRNQPVIPPSWDRRQSLEGSEIEEPFGFSEAP